MCFAPGLYISVADLAIELLKSNTLVYKGIFQCSNGHVNSQFESYIMSSAFIQIPLDEPPLSLQAWVRNMRMSSRRLCVRCQDKLVVQY